MKIIFIIDYFQPQIGYSEVFLLQEFKKMGHKVEVLTSNHYFPFPDYDDTVKSLLGDRVQPVGKRTEEGLSVERRPALIDVGNRVIFTGIKKKLAAFKPDLVIVNGMVSWSAIVASLLKPLFKYRLILRDSHLFSEYNRGPQLLKTVIYGTFRVLGRPIVEKHVDAFVAAADDTKTLIQSVYGIKKPVTVIPLGTDPTMYSFSARKRTSIRKQYGIAVNQFVILYTGKLVSSKGFEILCKAFQKLAQKHKNVSMLLVGAGNEQYVEECLSVVDSSYRKNVILVGFKGKTELPGFYSAADVAVWPLQESTSMLDAASSSLPFIVNNTIGTKERVSNQNALLYKKGNVHDLVKQLEYLLLNPTVRKEMGTRGRRLVLNRLSWNSLAQTYLNLVSL